VRHSVWTGWAECGGAFCGCFTPGFLLFKITCSLRLSLFKMNGMKGIVDNKTLHEHREFSLAFRCSHCQWCMKVTNIVAHGTASHWRMIYTYVFKKVFLSLVVLSMISMNILLSVTFCSSGWSEKFTWF
jgi:hypothetical protein